MIVQLCKTHLQRYCRGLYNNFSRIWYPGTCCGVDQKTQISLKSSKYQQFRVVLVLGWWKMLKVILFQQFWPLKHVHSEKIKYCFHFFYFQGPTNHEFGDVFWKPPKIFMLQVVLGTRPFQISRKGHQEESLEV